jgi:hypothetical protein
MGRIRFVIQHIPAVLLPPPLQRKVSRHAKEERTPCPADRIESARMAHEREEDLLRDVFRRRRRVRHSPGEAINRVLVLVESISDLRIRHSLIVTRPGSKRYGGGFSISRESFEGGT